MGRRQVNQKISHGEEGPQDTGHQDTSSRKPANSAQTLHALLRSITESALAAERMLEELMDEYENEEKEEA